MPAAAAVVALMRRPLQWKLKKVHQATAAATADSSSDLLWTLSQLSLARRGGKSSEVSANITVWSCLLRKRIEDVRLPTSARLRWEGRPGQCLRRPLQGQQLGKWFLSFDFLFTLEFIFWVFGAGFYFLLFDFPITFVCILRPLCHFLSRFSVCKQTVHRFFMLLFWCTLAGLGCLDTIEFGH